MSESGNRPDGKSKKERFQDAIDDAPVDSQREDIDWVLRGKAGRLLSMSKLRREVARETEEINPDFAENQRIEADHEEQRGSRLKLFRLTKDSGEKK